MRRKPCRKQPAESGRLARFWGPKRGAARSGIQMKPGRLPIRASINPRLRYWVRARRQPSHRDKRSGGRARWPSVYRAGTDRIPIRARDRSDAPSSIQQGLRRARLRLSIDRRLTGAARGPDSLEPEAGQRHETVAVPKHDEAIAVYGLAPLAYDEVLRTGLGAGSRLTPPFRPRRRLGVRERVASARPSGRVPGERWEMQAARNAVPGVDGGNGGGQHHNSVPAEQRAQRFHG